MAHNTIVFRQLLDLLPRHEFDAEARRHQKGQRLRVMSRWAQFVALGLGQLAGLQSLRDIVGNLRAQPHKLYHLGVRAFVSRSSLARVNTEQPYTLYETLFGRLLARCQQRAPRHGFRFKNKLFAVDASTIDLCLAAFPWASFRRTKGATLKFLEPILLFICCRDGRRIAVRCVKEEAGGPWTARRVCRAAQSWVTCPPVQPAQLDSFPRLFNTLASIFVSHMST